MTGAPVTFAPAMSDFNMTRFHEILFALAPLINYGTLDDLDQAGIPLTSEDVRQMGLELGRLASGIAPLTTPGESPDPLQSLRSMSLIGKADEIRATFLSNLDEMRANRDVAGRWVNIDGAIDALEMSDIMDDVYGSALQLVVDADEHPKLSTARDETLAELERMLSVME